MTSQKEYQALIEAYPVFSGLKLMKFSWLTNAQWEKLMDTTDPILKKLLFNLRLSIDQIKRSRKAKINF